MDNTLQYIVERLESIDGKYDEKLDKILEQTTKTNGRVSGHDAQLVKIQAAVEQHEKTIYYNKGRDRMVSIVIGAACTVLGFWINSEIDKKQTKNIENENRIRPDSKGNTRNSQEYKSDADLHIGWFPPIRNNIGS